MENTMWMVRAGRGGDLIDDFAEGHVAIGWFRNGEISSLNTKEEIREQYLIKFPHQKNGAQISGVAVNYKFKCVLKIGDNVVSYDRQNREYLVGEITSEYYHKDSEDEKFSQFRDVKWLGRVRRDVLKVANKNSLGSTLTLFEVNEHARDDILSKLKDEKSTTDIVVEPVDDEEDGLEQLRYDTIERSRDLIEDKILQLDADEMEELVAALLRAMGYKATVMPKGPDRGVDVLASPDGLGLESPRIKAEVKHRRGTQMGSNHIRSFTGGLREGDTGIYVSTGGFSKEARYEADRSNIPVKLIGLDDLAGLVVAHYENFDVEGKLLIPLVKIYWVAE